MAELLAAFAVLIAAPFCIGLLPALAMPGEETAWLEVRAGEEREKKEKRSLPWKRLPVSVCPVTVYVAGFVLMLAVFQIVAVPVILFETWGFPRIVTAYSILLAVLSAAGLVFGIPVLRGMAEDAHALIKGDKKLSLETALYWAVAVGLVLFQMYMAFTHEFFDGDDAYYVAQSVIAEQTDVLYRILPYTGLSTSLDIRHALAAFPIWEAYLARVTGIHPAIIAHSVLPLVLIPVTYLVYYRIGMRLFKGDFRKTAVFLILVSLLQIFGNTSIYTNATFFLMRTWQGKSILCNLVLLVAVWALLRLWETGKNGEKRGKKQAGWWFLMAANNVMAALATTMGAFLLGLFVGIAGLVLALRQKRPWYLIPLAATCLPGLIYLGIYAAVVFL
ncbi:MAG TPA: hypothetical protein H9717_15740 [Candidatus Eisenbergiella merdipullorum]|uniref:Uncharacterized protein n=1 Tax=Candidatus Eisenbergiella merdipullorum TaxID=2838553 RepID=A0A9D2I9W6_9FIRM|nr:hypothetical protein [Candidatus Eisenbergiella merdipullorum]